MGSQFDWIVCEDLYFLVAPCMSRGGTEIVCVFDEMGFPDVGGYMDSWFYICMVICDGNSIFKYLFKYLFGQGYLYV